MFDFDRYYQFADPKSPRWFLERHDSTGSSIQGDRRNYYRVEKLIRYIRANITTYASEAEACRVAAIINEREGVS